MNPPERSYEDLSTASDRLAARRLEGEIRRRQENNERLRTMLGAAEIIEQRDREESAH